MILAKVDDAREDEPDEANGIAGERGSVVEADKRLRALFCCNGIASYMKGPP